MLLKKNSEKRKQKKFMKENSLLEAAYNLFIEKGINNTAIDEIVRKAGVAKGTFYLYFKDKEDILEKLIIKKSADIVSAAIKETDSQNFDSPMDKLIFFIDYIIEYLNKNKFIFRFLKKDFSWVFYKKLTGQNDQFKEIKVAKERLFENIPTKYTKEELEIVIFMIIELISSITYSSIIKGEPAPIEKVKPLLFDIIRNIFDN